MDPNVRLAKSIEAYGIEIWKFRKKISGEMSKKSVHDLRIEVRRARSAVRLVRQYSRNSKIKRADHRLRRLARALGRVRELDVAIDDASSYHMKASKLKRGRQEFGKALLKVLSKKTLAHVRADLAGVSRKTSRMDRELLREAIADLRGEIAGWNKRRISNKSQIHGLRIAAKRTRYTLEALGEKVRPLIVLQDELGDLHDLEILKHLLGSNAQIEGDMRALKGKIHKLKLSALPFALKKLSTLANSKARFT